jgi:hypothetical protein
MFDWVDKSNDVAARKKKEGALHSRAPSGYNFAV